MSESEKVATESSGDSVRAEGARPSVAPDRAVAPETRLVGRSPTPRKQLRADWLPLDTVGGQALRGVRWAAIAIYLSVVGYYIRTDGLPLDREGLLLWIAIGLAVACIGRHPVWLLRVAIDFVPLAAVLIVYDYLRGLSDTVGLPTWWHPQIDVDKALFFGTEPTVWLQEHLKYADARWYDVAVCVCYFSFFFLPYVTAGVLWLRSRADFYRWSLRFVALSFFGFTLFMLIPAAPPWAAALCTRADVAGHPNNPTCMNLAPRVVEGNLLGTFTTSRPGANPYAERIIARGFYELHLGVAHSLLNKGYEVADAVAAVPSLHLGGTMLFVLFMWKRVNRWWRPLLVIYPLAMVFSLVYTAEHFVSDCIAGALLAWLVHALGNRIERRRKVRRDPDTLDPRGPWGQTPAPEATTSAPSTASPTQEYECPPIHPPPATTPSST